MRTILTLCLLLFFLSKSFSQGKYEQYIVVDSLTISTKWASAKDDAGEKKPALLFKVQNANSQAVLYGMEILFYYEGMLRERGQMENLCLDAGKTANGKLNGLYFVPTEFTEDQLKNSDFSFEVESIQVEEVDLCE